MSKLLADECRKRAAEQKRRGNNKIQRSNGSTPDLAAMWRLIAMNSEETESV